jgi:lipopolysaccharide O-acetyltransferase
MILIMGTLPDRALGSAFLSVYRLYQRAVAKGFSVAAGGAFASYGARSVIQPPVRLEGEEWIEIGTGVFIGPNCWLRAAPAEHPASGSTVLQVGDGTSIVGNCVLSAVASVRIGQRVLFARNVYVADHRHAYESRSAAVMDQGVTSVAPVEIGDGAWLGENVYVAPGVRIGTGAVVGANAVVLDDVPDWGVAVGIPARVIRTHGET